MKTWIKRLLIALAGAGVVVGSLTACGHRMHHAGWGHDATPEQAAQWRARMVDRVAGKLDLDADQKARLVVLGDKLHAQRMAVRGQAEPRIEMRSLIAGDRFDRTKAQSLVQQKTEAVRVASPEVIAALGDFYDSLNAAQQEKVRAFMDRRGGWRRGG